MTVQAETTSSPEIAAAQARFGPGYRRWLLFMLVLIYTSNFVDRQIFTTLIQPIKKDLHLTDTQLGYLSGLTFAVFYTFLGIPIARLLERKSRIVVMTLCITVWSIMTGACGVAQNFIQLAIARVGVGVGEAGCLPAANALVSDHFPKEKRTTALGVFTLGIPIGSMIGAMAGGWIAQHLNWRSAFFMVGAPGLVIALLTVLTLREPPRGLADGGKAPPTAPPLTAVIKRLLSRPTALWICVAAGVSAAGTYGTITFAAAYFIRRFGFDFTHAGLAAGLISGVGAGVSVISGGLLTDRLAKTNILAFAWVPIIGLVLAVPLYLIGFTRPDAGMALVFLIAAAALQQLYLAPTFAIANNVAEPRMRATSVSLMSFVWNFIGLGFGPVIVGALSDRMAKALPAGRSDYLGLCRKAACADASATGLQYALIGVTGMFVLGALLYGVASLRMKRDLAD